MESILAVWIVKGLLITTEPRVIKKGRLLGFVRGKWSVSFGQEPFRISKIFADTTGNAAKIAEYFREP